MRVIVIGCGEVGQHIARTLSAERHSLTVVDSDAVRVETAQSELDALVVVGNGASPKFLREIGVADSDLLCAVTHSDEANVIAALAARQLGARRTVARVRDFEYFGDDDSFARDELGIDFVINPERATAEDLAAAVVLPGAVHVEYFGDGKVAVAESILTARSPLVGQPLSSRRIVRPSFVFGLIRDGRAIATEPGHRPKAGDHVLVAAARGDIEPVVAHIAGRAQRVRDVIVFGGGRIGVPLAQFLQAAGGMRVTVMERDAERARYVAEQVRDITVLHEEGVSKQALLAHGVDRAGAFVACAGDDRANLLAALHAKQLGAGLCLSVVSREEFTPLVDALGIDGAVSPRLVTAEAILRAVRGPNVHGMYLLSGGAEVVEVQADPGCEAEGRTVEQANKQALTHVTAIVRNGRVVIPEDDVRLHAHDRLVVFNTRQGVASLDKTFAAAA
ncbi:MAG TPA: Trk system potassium transporter TrkA [Solirubrobacteraceae bacterium]|nr:Trk system potassium transporter TrkA [Solirubrobacteraceae bacterium]